MFLDVATMVGPHLYFCEYYSQGWSTLDLVFDEPHCRETGNEYYFSNRLNY